MKSSKDEEMKSKSKMIVRIECGNGKQQSIKKIVKVKRNVSNK
jgi:hypothetical protein